MAIAQIGQILVENGALTQEQLDHALLMQKETPSKKLGEILLDFNMVTYPDFMRAYAQRNGVKYYDIKRMEIPEETIRLIPEKLATDKKVLPIKLDGNRLTVVTENPMDFNTMDDIKILTGFEVETAVAINEEIMKKLHDVYSEAATKDVLETLNSDFDDEATQTIADLDREIAELGEKIDSAPVVKLVNTIITESYRKGASDIHVEPTNKKTRVRIRIDGELVEQMQISLAAHNALVTRIKIMSDMNIAEKRVPQDGRIGINIDGKTIDLRVSTLPTIDGEKIVIRLMGTSGKQVTQLEQLGMRQRDYDVFTDMLKNPNGVIMVTGPTGSGKSTTLYAALAKIATPNINVVTVEDPVERNMDGINQVHVNQKAGLTFAAALRSILRQDPDVVMIGEIRDGETASIAVRAAITGHLVLSTIHTNDAVSTISRLVDMGIEPYLVSSSLVGVIAQRLVKLLCPHCAGKRMTTEQEMKLLGITEPAVIYDPVGCDECNGTGYAGRTAIYEMIKVTPEIKQLIARSESEDNIKKLAREQGASFLRESVTELVLDGKTDMRQLIRTTYSMD